MSNRQKKRVNQRQIIFLIAFIGLLIAGTYFYLDYKRTSHLKLANLVNQDGKNYGQIYLEIADTPEKRAKGLMYRQKLSLDQGMLFKFDETKIQSIWMKNTYLSLDLFFLSPNYQIVGIIPKVPILNEISRKVEVPSRYVVELNAGSVERLGIKLGDTFKLDS